MPWRNSTGPETLLNKRLNENLTQKEWSNPINRVDESSFESLHLFVTYSMIEKKQTRNELGKERKKMEELNILNLTLRERIKIIVQNIMKTKMKFGMGVSAS